jgi:hypothetical protein
MWPPAHFQRPLSDVLRQFLLGTINGRLTLTLSIVGIVAAAFWQPFLSVTRLTAPAYLQGLLVLAPLPMFVLFVVWPPSEPKPLAGSIIRWLFMVAFFLAPAFLSGTA